MASPFTNKELDFLNALAVVTGDSIRYHPEGIDWTDDGSIDRGWHDLEVLETPADLVVSGRLSCDPERAKNALNNVFGKEREWVKQFILVAKAWLC